MTSLMLLPSLYIAAVMSVNPLVSNVGMADSHVHEYNGIFYMYATHDYSPTNTGFRMDDWNVWSSPDLVDWTLATTLFPNQTAASPSDYHECWATDSAHKDGQYYFYQSLGPGQVGVVNSSTPVGPWENFLGTPLLNTSFGQHVGATFRDPCAFQDTDGETYLIAGVFDYFIAKLGPDLMSLAEYPQKVQVLNPTGPYGAKTDDKPFMHKANGLYYLSWGCFYGTGASPYGPFQYVGSAIDTAFLAPDFRMNQTTGPWYGWEDYADRHGSFFTNQGGQSFYSSNDRSHSSDSRNPSVYRDTVLGYVHYFANGTIAPVVIDAQGVGSYRAAHIEAENFMHLSGGLGVKGHDSRGAFGVHSASAGTVLRYPHVSGGEGARRVVLRAGNGSGHAGRVSVASAAPGGQERLLCSVAIPATGGWEAYAQHACDIAGGGLGADEAVTLTFEGGEEGLPFAWLDSFALLP